MKRFAFLTLSIVQLIFNGVLTPIYYLWLHDIHKVYSVVISCLYAVSAIFLPFNRRYAFVIVNLVTHMIPFIVNIGLTINFISSRFDYFYIQLLTNIILDVAIYIFGIFYVGKLTRETVDPYARFGNYGDFTQ